MLPPSFSSHPWLLTFSDYNPLATHKSRSSPLRKSLAGYLPSSINFDLCLSKQNRHKKKEKRKKKPSCLPSSQPTAEWKAGLVTMGTGCLPPAFLRIGPGTSSALPPPGIQPRALSLVYCYGGPRSADEYSRAEGC